MKVAPLTIDYRPKLPPKCDYGIGVVGCGGIVNYAHLPAYKAHGLNILGCYDVNSEAAQSTARTHGIPTTFESLDDLLADSRIAIVDIAVPAVEQRAIAERALARGKHLLCQKPLAENLADAAAIAAAGRTARRKVAVNQQMRWSPGIAAAKRLVEEGCLGTPIDVQIQVSVDTPLHMWPWLNSAERFDLLYHSIHYFDSIRFLFGRPDTVTSRHTRFPGPITPAETKTITVFDYPAGLQGLVAVNHLDRTRDAYATFRFLGTEGLITGTIGLLYDYPRGRPDTLRVESSILSAEAVIDVGLEGSWIPDAFIGPMASLMDAIQRDATPITDAHDNLDTLRMVFGGYRSNAEGRTIRLDEV